MTQRLLIGVVSTIALAIALTAPAHARTSIKNYNQTVSSIECFTNEDHGGGRRICNDHRASANVPRVHSHVAKVTRPPASKPAIEMETAKTFVVDDLVRKARAYIGMTAGQVGVRRDLWCSAFMRKIAGSPRGVDDRAISWNSQPHVPARVGAIIIVRSRRIHVGVVSGFDKKGNPIVVSGNHGNRVAESVYPRSSVIAYVAPKA